MNNFITREDLPDLSALDVGAKAYNLFILRDKGFNVPDLFAVPDRLLKKYLTDKALSADIEAVKSNILHVVFEPGFIKELQRLTDPQKLYAVRSSAIAEDSQEHSFAGQLSSFLFVPAQDIPDYIKKVWLSYFSDHVLAYRKHNNLIEDVPKIAVLIQEMVNSAVSGVSFNMNPVNGSRREIVISAVYGLGEGLVSGELDADIFTVNNNRINTRISTKEKALFYDSRKKTTVLNDVQAQRQKVPSLTEQQVHEIAAATRSISDFYGKPQDIEWTIMDDSLYILQSRPITTLNSVPDKDQQYRIWDNSNIIESYPGVTTPLTFSFVKGVYTHVYKHFCRVMGVEEPVIEKNDGIFEMLGFIKGRIYYNLLNWYKVLSLLPGYSINAAFMEQMMGVTEKIEYQDTVIKSTQNKYWRLMKMILRLFINFFTLKKQVKKFHALIDNTLKNYSYNTLKALNPDALVDSYQKLENELISRWNTPLVNDFLAMIFFGILKKLLEKWALSAENSLHNDLLSAEGGIISVGPIRSLQALSNSVIRSKTLTEIFTTEDNAEILKQLDNQPDFKTAFEKHVNTYGDRVAGELKLESITAKHDPTIIIRFLKSYIQGGWVDMEEMALREKDRRKEAESIIKKGLSWHPFKKIVLNYVLNKARLTIRNRENLRFERTRVYAAIRNIFKFTGQALYRESLINDPMDIFYLSKDEIIGFISGSVIDENIQQVIEKRKDDFTAYREMAVPDRFGTWGPLYHANSFDSTANPGASSDGLLKGIGCSPGIVSGRVVVVHDPAYAENLKGCILVAEKTDPGWAPLFPLASGLLVQRGSLLSHSAIVAREMRIPAIVSIPDLLNTLKTGDNVRFNGSTGEIEILGETDE